MNFGNELALAIGKAATILPPDVVRALEAARDREAGPARVQLEAILENVRIAREGKVPICQDTGTITFFVRLGMGFPHLPALVDALPEAARAATKAVPLRPNTVHPFTGKNPGDNTGRYIPAVTWEMTDGDGAEIHILPKGGGSENCSALKMLAPGVGLKGVKEAVVEHVVGCGGLPCPPTVVGVGIGGGADLALKLGKMALLRPLGQRHPEPEVAALEAELEDLINASGVGPMGLGGKTTVLAVHAEYAHRHPASLPVGIVTQCWAHRRATVRVRADGRMEVA
ncbi:MAG: fumarate hydratase [Candidatus Bipolaricaulis anaerobius]|nr:fumarate hydratase [Candidatus Bipolaricaulis anaerobius]